ncbi:MAG: hemin ABC transporter substrate-binding protein [Thermoanaerobaculia bacterium]
MRLPPRTGVLGALLALFAVGGARAEAPAGAGAARIVTLGSATTEIAFGLGAGAELVGVDSSSLYPEAATRLPQIGYQRQISAEGVLSLAPTLVIATDESGPPAALEQLASAGVRVFMTQSPRNGDEAAQRIVDIGNALGRPDAARRLAEALRQEMVEVARLVATFPVHPRVLFIYARAGGAPTVAGRNTAADAMLRMAGAVNASDDFEGYKALTPEAAVAANPEILLLVTRGLESLGGEAALWRLPGLRLTSAGKAHRLVVVDDLEFLSFGPRLASTLSSLTRTLHDAPMQAPAPMPDRVPGEAPRS